VVEILPESFDRYVDIWDDVLFATTDSVYEAVYGMLGERASSQLFLHLTSFFFCFSLPSPDFSLPLHPEWRTESNQKKSNR